MKKLFRSALVWYVLDYDTGEFYRTNSGGILNTLKDYDNIVYSTGCDLDYVIEHKKWVTYNGDKFYIREGKYFTVSDIGLPIIDTPFPYKVVMDGNKFLLWVDGRAYCFCDRAFASLNSAKKYGFSIIDITVTNGLRILSPKLEISETEFLIYTPDMTNSTIEVKNLSETPKHNVTLKEFLRRVLMEK